MSHSVNLSANRPGLFWRGVAGLATGLLLFLLVASMCPALHERCCHHHDQTDASAAACVVFAFAEGIAVPAVAAIFTAPVDTLVFTLSPSGERLRIVVEAWRNPPSCGPPAAV